MVNGRLIDNVKTVTGCAPAALTTTAGDGDYVSLKSFRYLRITIAILNGTTVTGGTITLKQATDVAGTSEKALSFAKMFANTDTGASDTLTETAVTSDTFTTNATNGKKLLYQIEVRVSDLDINHGFDCVRVEVADMANAIGVVLYDLYGNRGSNPLSVSVITD